MQRFALFPLILAVALAACSEAGPDPMGVAVDGPAFFASHGSILDPDVDYEVNGYDVTIRWSWEDPEDDWWLVSFELHRNGVLLTDDIPNAKPYAAGTMLDRDVTDEGLEPGTYEYCVEVMAKLNTVPALTHHSRSCVDVTVGSDTYHAVFTYVPAGGTGAAVENDADGYTTALLDLRRNPAKWELKFKVMKNLTVIDTCAPTSDYSTVGVRWTQSWENPAGTINDEDGVLSPLGCTTGEYTIELPNEARSGPNRFDATGTLMVELDGTAVDNVVNYDSSS